MPDHDVLIVGAGPTGLMLAAELARAGADVALLERRETQSLDGSRAGGLHPRSLELLDQRGLADPFVAAGKPFAAMPFPGTTLDLSDLSSRFPFWLALWQQRIEELLAAHVADLRIPLLRGAEVTAVTPDPAVTLADGRRLSCHWLVGCDGGRSLVRRAAGLAFPGTEPTLSYLIYEADFDTPPPLGLFHGDRGIRALGPRDGGPLLRGVVTEPVLRSGGATPADLDAALAAAYGPGHSSPRVTWLSRFTDATRQADSYRAGRILIAGDAAHIHSPVGGQGLNLGLQDAVNLGWKLARVLAGTSPDSLLDSYTEDRHAPTARILAATRALTALNRGDPGTTALRILLAPLVAMDEPRRAFTAMMSGLDIRLDAGGDHPLAGLRLPDVPLTAATGPLLSTALLHAARPFLLNLGPPGSVTARGLACHDLQSHGPWSVPLLGPVAPPPLLLVRPDGHIAFAGRPDDPALPAALAFRA